MRKVRIFEHMSLDGVIQASDEDGDFPYGEWMSQYRTPEGAQILLGKYGERYDLLLGRKTYDAWAGFWPTMTTGPWGERINAATKHVVTHRPQGLSWGPSAWVGEDLIEGVQRLKAGDGPDLIVCGSSTITAPLMDEGLVDEVVLLIYPVWLGTGKRFMAGTAGHAFKLVETSSSPTGIVVNSYDVVGPLKTA